MPFNNQTTLKLDASEGDDSTVNFAGTPSEIQLTTPTTGNNGEIKIGLPDDVTIGQDLTVTTNLTVNGDLLVNGTTTTLNTQDLHIEDRFIVIGAAGSTAASNTDVGIIFDSGSVDGAGMALFYKNSTNRLAVGKDVTNINMGPSTAIEETGATGTVAGDIVTVTTETTVTPSSTPAQFGQGEIKIDNNGDIWMYLD